MKHFENISLTRDSSYQYSEADENLGAEEGSGADEDFEADENFDVDDEDEISEFASDDDIPTRTSAR